jgi:hypothetical protein
MMESSPTDEQMRAFAQKLAAFAETLSAEEQSMLLTLLDVAPDADEVTGYMSISGPPPQAQRSVLLPTVMQTTALTNILVMRHETLKGITQNLRG